MMLTKFQSPSFLSTSNVTLAVGSLDARQEKTIEKYKKQKRRFY